MNDSMLSVKLLSSKWDNMVCKDRPEEDWVAQMDSSQKELDLHDKHLTVQFIRKILDTREREEFKMAIQHKYKLCTYIGS